MMCRDFPDHLVQFPNCRRSPSTLNEISAAGGGNPTVKTADRRRNIEAFDQVPRPTNSWPPPEGRAGQIDSNAIPKTLSSAASGAKIRAAAERATTNSTS